MKIKTMYVADDNKVFETLEECIDYENKNMIGNLIFFDNNFNRLGSSANYVMCKYLLIKDEDALKCLKYLNDDELPKEIGFFEWNENCWKKY